MQVYLPIAELSVHAEAILGLGVFVGILSGLFGIGGGFLTTPFLIFMGLPPAIAVGTQSTQLIASSVSGALGHWRRGDLDMKMGGVMLGGSLFGSLIGAMFFRLLQHIGQIDLVIPVLYVLLLGGMGCAMLVESTMTVTRKSQPKKHKSKYLYRHPFFTALPYKMKFPRSRIYVSAFVPGGIGFVGGLLTTTLGIGGGFMLVPAMIYFLGMPTLLVAGTSLYRIMFTATIAALMHAVASQTVDLVLAALLITGGVIGAQFGVRLGKKIKGAYARVLLAVILLLVASQLAWQLFIPPAELYSTTVRGGS